MLTSQQQFTLANNDAYLNGNSNVLIPFGVLPPTNNAISSFEWIFNVDGTVVIQSGNPTVLPSTLLPLASHTQLSTSVILQVVKGRRRSFNGKTRLETLVCWYADSVGYPIPGTQFNLQIQFQQKSKAVYSITIYPFHS